MGKTMNSEISMLETSHQLIQSERDGEMYCRRCGLYNASAEEQPCISLDRGLNENGEAAA
jgi:hypothetical protein